MKLWKQQSYQNLLIATDCVWAKSSLKEQSDLTERGMDHRGQGWHTTALFNLSLSGQWMHLSSSPPAADWMGQNSVCHGVTLPFPESSARSHSLFISRSGQRCHCEAAWPLGFCWPLSLWEVHHHQAVQWVALTLYHAFHSASPISLRLLFCYHHANSTLNIDIKSPHKHPTMPWQSDWCRSLVHQIERCRFLQEKRCMT